MLYLLLKGIIILIRIKMNAKAKIDCELWLDYGAVCLCYLGAGVVQ